MSLRFAILALLSADRMTGYDVVRVFDDSVGFIWHASHSQIYPEMRRMAADGLLSAEEIPRGQRGLKTLYGITEDGIGQLERLAGRVAEPPREKDAIRLQASYFEFASHGRARRQLEVHADHYTRWLEIWERVVQDLRDQRFPLLRTRLSHVPEERHHVVIAFKVFAYEGLIARAKTEIEWARRGIRLIDDLGEEALAGGFVPVLSEGLKRVTADSGSDRHE